MCLSPSLEVNKESTYIKVVAEVDRVCLQITALPGNYFFSEDFLCKMPASFNSEFFFLQIPVMGIHIILLLRKV